MLAGISRVYFAFSRNIYFTHISIKKSSKIFTVINTSAYTVIASPPRELSHYRWIKDVTIGERIMIFSVIIGVFIGSFFGVCTVAMINYFKSNGGRNEQRDKKQSGFNKE
jgi:uncharacterized membrane-anchored protein YitT (DUF2179 family)